VAPREANVAHDNSLAKDIGSFMSTRSVNGHELFPDLRLMISRMGVVNSCHLGLRAIRNVWSAALSQAKNESDRMVCANVFGLCGAQAPGLDGMRCALVLLVMQPWKAFPDYRFRERRVKTD
jgi:hypothetical protein